MPLQHFHKLKITSLSPQGWVLEFLKRQESGLTGHIEVAGYPFNTCLWAGERMEGSPTAWWPYEQTAYYLDGALRLGYLLRSRRLLDKVHENLDYVRDHVTAEGRFATPLSERWRHWPYASFNRAFMCEWETTGDPVVVELLRRHYLSFSAADFADVLELANVEHLCWVYGETGDQRLLNLAQEAYALFQQHYHNRNWEDCDIQFDTDSPPTTHAVVYLELVKVPLILYSHTGELRYRLEAERGLRSMLKHHMLASGLPSSTEHFEGSAEDCGSETCNAATMPYTLGYFLRITGVATYGDAIEKAVFNGGLGAITKDFRSHQYFSAPNQVVAALDSNPYGHHAARMAYLPGHDVECCTGNVNRFMPYYVEQMWLGTEDGGLAAALLGPCSVTAEVGQDKVPVTIQELTEYPHTSGIDFRFSMPRSAHFPLQVRIPDWCKAPVMALNGGALAGVVPGEFFRLDREFHDGDLLRLELPMEVTLSHWPNGGIAVERGPLVYSAPIVAEETAVEYGKSSTEFPALERRAAGPWNFGVGTEGLDTSQIAVTTRSPGGYPWDAQNAPISLRLPVRPVRNWRLRTRSDLRVKTKITRTTAFPRKPEYLAQGTTLELIPYGCTLLRITVFPTVSDHSSC